MDYRAAIEKIITKHFVSQTADSEYMSEASVQLKLGMELHELLKVEPVLENEISKRKRGKQKRQYLDVFFKRHRNKVGIELKYKTKKLRVFRYEDQGAQNNGKYDFISDISRLESCCKRKVISHGLAILITNDPRYWTPSRESSKVHRFDLNEDITLAGRFNPNWKGRTSCIQLKGSYEVGWEPGLAGEWEPIVRDKARFRYLIIEIREDQEEG